LVLVLWHFFDLPLATGWRAYSSAGNGATTGAGTGGRKGPLAGLGTINGWQKLQQSCRHKNQAQSAGWRRRRGCAGNSFKKLSNWL
jgi:hypothetical protein